MYDSRLVEEVMSLPDDERLDHAIRIIRELTAVTDADVSHWRAALGLTVTETRLLTLILRRPGWTVSYDEILRAVWGYDSDVNPKIVSVYICKIRKKLPHGVVIETIYGEGFRVSPEHVEALLDFVGEPRASAPRRASAPAREPCSRRREKWTAEEDLYLLEMARNGSEIWAMAEEFGRTERAVTERLTKLRTKGKHR